MPIQVVEFSSGGYKIRKIFAQESTYQKEIIILSFELSKIGHHFSNKKIQKLILSKNVNNKKCAPKLVFFKKKLRKVRRFLI
jgi:hypothetical protein